MTQSLVRQWGESGVGGLGATGSGGVGSLHRTAHMLKGTELIKAS